MYQTYTSHEFIIFLKFISKLKNTINGRYGAIINERLEIHRVVPGVEQAMRYGGQLPHWFWLGGLNFNFVRYEFYDFALLPPPVADFFTFVTLRTKTFPLLVAPWLLLNWYSNSEKRWTSLHCTALGNNRFLFKLNRTREIYISI